MVIIKYENESEVQGIINAQTALGLHLISVSNVTEGNFLGFDDRNVAPPVQTYSNQELKDNQLTLMDVLATMTEALTAKGTM